MDSEGMVAVVRGLREAGLAVTVVDGDKKYTLMPSTDVSQRMREIGTSLTHRESGAQAVDGRYTSTYQTAHCNMKPTSPPVQLSEFPPQRSNVHPGHSNFEVGGLGSGETYPYTKSTSFRGAMNWPDRGCVCSPRNSHESSAFINSLRKYPDASLDRSTEFVERLLNNSQPKNFPKCSTQRNHQSPADKTSPRGRQYDPDISIRVRKIDDSPTKEKKKCDCRDFKFPVEYDVRCLKDMSKRVKDCVRANYPFKLPANPTIRENYGRLAFDHPNMSVNSVDTESLAAVKMVSREVSTVPRPVLARRTISIPLTPTSSAAKLEEFSVHRGHDVTTSAKIYRTSKTSCRVSPRSVREFQVAPVTNSKQDIRASNSKDDLQEELSEWLAIQSDKLKVKIWWDKLHKLAMKLKDPAEEKNLRSKIEKFLETAPSAFSDEDEEKMEFRRQLPNYIIKKLKKMYLKFPNSDVNERKSDIPKYYSRYKIDLLKSTILHWLKNIKLCNNDSASKLKREDIFKDIVDKLEPLILDRPKKYSEYKNTLTYTIADMVNDLPIIIDSKSKKRYLNTITMVLVNDILHIDAKIPITYIQPTDSEVKHFVIEQITYLLEKTSTAISTKRMKRLETELTDLLLNLTDVKDVDNSIHSIEHMLKHIANLPEDKAKYFSNIIIIDYKEFFFREHYFNVRDNDIVAHPDIYPPFYDKPNSTSTNKINDLGEFKQQLKEVVDKWFTDINTQIKDANSKDKMVKKITSDIMYRLKYIKINPDCKGTDLEELEHLNYQIFKRINHLGAENSSITIKHTKELMELVKQIPYPVPFHAGSYQSNLKLKIKSTLEFTNDDGDCTKKNIKQDKKMIRHIKDIIEEWIDTLPLDANAAASFLNIRNDVSHELAVIIYESKLKPNEKLLDDILDIIKRLPFDQQFNTLDDRYRHAVRLINMFEECYVNKKSETKLQRASQASVTEKLESVILDWLKPLSLNQNQTELKVKHVLIVNELAIDLQKAIFNGGDVDDVVIKHLSKLDIDQSEEFARNAAIQLKQSLQKSGFIERFSNNNCEEELLEATIEAWVDRLPVNIKKVDNLETQKKTFVKSIKRFKVINFNDDRVIKETIQFMKSLPIEISCKQNEKYLYDEAHELTQILKQETTCKENSLNNRAIIKSVSDAIRDWAKLLPIEPEYNHRELKQVVEEMTTVVATILNHPDYRLLERNNQLIKEEIIKYLQRIPLKSEYEQRVSKITHKLAKNLKNITLNCTRDKNGTKTNRSNITVYGVAVQNTSEEGNITTGDIVADLDAYTRQICYQINDWLNNLNLQINQDEGLKSVVINDLAGDIVDRQKYLQLNPESKKSSEDELEQLKFQIFKWINKLVGDENIDTIAHAEDLMKKIQSVPAPLLANTVPRDSLIITRKVMSKSKLTKEEVENLPKYGPSTDGGSFRQESSRTPSKRMSSPAELAILRSSEEQTQYYQNRIEAIFEKYQKLFKEKMYELPIDTSTPESAQLAQLARTAMFNGIMKTFLRLKADPDLANDYGYFELILDDRLDEMLDIIPQTDEMKKTRHRWKVDIILKAMDMLGELQRITDSATFRQRLKDGFNRRFARNMAVEECFLLQQGFLTNMADAYILETKFKEEDPIKANIYKQRLMTKIDELANHLTKEHNIEFGSLKKSFLIQHAMKVLDSVPIPQDDILDEEVAEILLAEEIEKWYKELPTKPYINELDPVLRKRMIELLSKKLCEIDRNEEELDDSKEIQMKHEMSKFLAERGKLEKGEDLNINFMVDELSNRIKNMKLKDVTYDAFARNKPAASTFAEMENAEILAPLIDAPSVTRTLVDESHHDVSVHQPELTPCHQCHGRASQVTPQSITQSHLPASICPGTHIQITQGMTHDLVNQPSQNVAHHSSLPLSNVEVKSNQIGRSVAYRTQPDARGYLDSSQVGLRHNTRNLSRPGPPPNTPYEVHLNPNETNQGLTTTQQNITNQSIAQAPFAIASGRNTTPRSRQVSPSYSFRPSAPPQNMVSRASSPSAHTNQGIPTRSPRGASLNANMSQFGPGSNDYIQRQAMQSPINISRDETNPQIRRRGFTNQDLIQDFAPEDPRARYGPHPGNMRICRNFSADFGIPCPVHDDDREDEEEGKERFVIKCRCMERLRRRRRICLNSLPCPELRSPCRYYFD